MYAHPMMPLVGVFPLVKVSNIIVDVTLEYCGFVGRIGLHNLCIKKQALLFFVMLLFYCNQHHWLWITFHATFLVG